MGVRHSLFPMLALGAPGWGAVSFPTLFSTASGVCGLVAGPSSFLRCWNLSEAFQLASAGGCGHRLANQVKDTSAIDSPRLNHLAPGRPLLVTARLPGATGLAS